MYAIIEVGGKQHKVEAGKWFLTEKIDANVGDKVEFDAMLVAGDKKVSVGSPVVKDTKVVCEVLEHGKEDKVVVFKYKAKKNERKKQGHRQPYTKLMVVSIG